MGDPPVEVNPLPGTPDRDATRRSVSDRDDTRRSLSDRVDHSNPAVNVHESDDE